MGVFPIHLLKMKIRVSQHPEPSWQVIPASDTLASSQDWPGKTPSLLCRLLSPWTHPEGQPHCPDDPSPGLAK